MKSKMVKLIPILVLYTMFSLTVSAQHVRIVRAHQHPRCVVVKHQRPILPRTVIRYRPHWAKRVVFTHRWVYFPRCNFYWDNVRARYVYPRGGVWVVAATLPPAYSKVVVEREVRYELNDEADATDDIYYNNQLHVSTYKVK